MTIRSLTFIAALAPTLAFAQVAPPVVPPPPQPKGAIIPAVAEKPPAQLDRFLRAAVATFKRGEFAESGSICFQAAAYAESLGDPTEPVFSEAIARLRLLGYDAASHDVKAPERFDQSAAAIHIALAREALRTAQGAWAERRAKATGESLGYAADHLERAIVWGGHNTSEQGEATLALAERNARELTNDTLQKPPPGLVTTSLRDMEKMTSAVSGTLATAREEIGFDERVGTAAEKAVDGIQTGTRKAAEAVGGTFKRWGKWLEDQADQ